MKNKTSGHFEICSSLFLVAVNASAAVLKINNKKKPIQEILMVSEMKGFTTEKYPKDL